MKAKHNQNNAQGHDTKDVLKLHPHRLLQGRLAVIGVWPMIGRQSDVRFAAHVPSNPLDIA